ncbi:STAS domain-containing protein [Solirubrobacter taibaiensis]|nr:STAS domain-containing protein [Solirubrobacter taibaiensis]
MSSQSSFDGTGDPPPFACHWRAEGALAASVTVSGDVDLATAPQLERALHDACALAPLVLLDLSAVSFMDSSGLHVLVAAATRRRRSGTRVVMLGASPQIEALLVLTGTYSVFDALPVMSTGTQSVRNGSPTSGEREPGFRPLANPVNASVIAARVMDIPDFGLWLHASDGTILQAWAPADGTPVPTGGTVDIYFDRQGTVNGWRHADSGMSINQRRLPPGVERATAVPLACQGSCGVTWQAPAARQLIEHDEHCLTCAGPLVPV